MFFPFCQPIEYLLCDTIVSNTFLWLFSDWEVANVPRISNTIHKNCGPRHVVCSAVRHLWSDDEDIWQFTFIVLLIGTGTKFTRVSTCSLYGVHATIKSGFIFLEHIPGSAKRASHVLLTAGSKQDHAALV